MKKDRSSYIFRLIMLVLFLPILQMILHLFSPTPLAGVSDKTVLPDRTWDNWSSSKYQDQLEQYTKENFAFREDVVRVHNQFLYSLYGEEKNNSVIMGKEGYLYEKPYLTAFYGHDFVGRKTIETKLKKLKEIQHVFDTLGKELLVVFAPNKARYYPEYLPTPRLKDTIGKIQNYDVYKQLILEKNIPLIDVDAWFLGMKNTSPYPLIPKGGIHWSSYGEIMFGDSLLSYIGQKIGKDVTRIDYSDIEVSTVSRDRDDDIEKLLNTMWGIENLPMAYPKIKYQTENKYRPKVLLIGDSYYSGLYFIFGFQKGSLDPSSEYWYYFSKMYPVQKKHNHANIKSAISNKDIVVLLISTYGLKDFGWGGIEKLHEVYCKKHNNNPSQNNTEMTIAELQNKIKNTPKWIARLQKKSKDNNISLDSILHLEIQWILENKN